MCGIIYTIGGANYSKEESLLIDLDILKESNKKNPNVLYIGAAMNDCIDKINQFCDYYNKLGFNVEVLDNYNNLNEDYISERFKENDIIYFAGGMTERLIEFSKKHNLLKLIKEAFVEGKILVGVSAGAILFFDYGYGDRDAYIYNLETTNNKITSGLGILNGIFCPHYQNNGLISFNDIIKDYNKNGFALENGAALKINEHGFYIVKSKHSNAFMFDYHKNHCLIYLKSNQFYEINLFK